MDIARDTVVGLLDFIQCFLVEKVDVLGIFQQDIAGFRQGNLVLTSNEQLRSEHRLEVLDLVGHGGLGKIEELCSACKTVHSGYCHENLEIEVNHSANPYGILPHLQNKEGFGRPLEFPLES